MCTPELTSHSNIIITFIAVARHASVGLRAGAASRQVGQEKGTKAGESGIEGNLRCEEDVNNVKYTEGFA